MTLHDIQGCHIGQLIVVDHLADWRCFDREQNVSDYVPVSFHSNPLLIAMAGSSYTLGMALRPVNDQQQKIMPIPIGGELRIFYFSFRLL